MAEAVRIVVVDDHSVVRRGTREILEQDPHLEVVGEAADGHEAVSRVDDTQPDVVLMDIAMPEMNGIAATRTIKKRWPWVRVLILTVHDDDEFVWEAIQSGASGYLLKDVGEAELVRAVRIVASGGALLDPAVTTAVMGRVRSGMPTAVDMTPSLTTRELDVLRLLAKGFSNRTIAERLEVSSRTVEVHVRHIFEKLDATSRTEAVVLALRRGILSLDQPREPG